MSKRICMLVVLLGEFITLAAQQVPSLLPREEDEACRQWVESRLSGMSLEEKVGQTFVCKLSPEWNRKNQKLIQQLVKKYKVGGLLFSEGEANGQVKLTNLAQREAATPLMITFDGEWGPAMRLKDMPLFPKNMALGCVSDPSLIEEYAREVARELRLLGVSVNFAPDADVNTNLVNPIINVRSFGSDPEFVAERVIAYGRGLESGGVLSVSKHFPGHGDTDQDSHITLPVIYYNRERLDSIEILPFREVIKTGLGGIMVGHLRVPAMEPDGLTAASLSQNMVNGILKGKLGFRGLVFTDALGMQAISHERNVAVRALKAGNDMLLVGNNVEKELESVMVALEQGELEEQDIDAKCRKILTYKYLLGLSEVFSIDPDGLVDRINTAGAQELAAKLRLSAITILRNHFHTFPLPEDQRLAVLSIGKTGVDQPFISRFSQYASSVEHLHLTKEMTENERQKLAEDLTLFHRVVVCVTAGREEVRQYASFLNSLQLEVPVSYIFFTSYREMLPIQDALGRTAAVVLAHVALEDVQKQVADICFAKAEATGRLSIDIPGLFKIGEASDVVPGMKSAIQPEECGMKGYILHRIDSVLTEGLNAGAYPGCQMLILKNGIPVYNRCLGVHSDKDHTAVRSTDMFDLASMTKTTATLLAVMKLYDQGKLKLTDKASAYLSWLRSSDKKNITIRELLLHESGLLPYIRFYREVIDDNTVTGPFTQGFVDKWHYTRMGEYTYACSDFKFKKGLMSLRRTSNHTLRMADDMWLNNSFKNTVFQAIARSEMSEKRYLYSDLGFVILQQIVESITKKPMDEYLNQEFYKPMKLDHTLFLPLNRYSKSEVMPTAANDYLRRQDLCGYVHDETASCLGGVSGNAGLFSTADEVGEIYQMLLNGGEWKGQRYLSEATVKLFTTETSAISHRGLGFDKPNILDAKASNCAPNTPACVYGHTGFTGTCVWVDPQEKMVYVFLSNRVCPNVWNDKLVSMKIRQGIQKVIYESIK